MFVLPASLATALTSCCLISAMYPSTVKMTNPDRKLVRQFTELVSNASLQGGDKREGGREPMNTFYEKTRPSPLLHLQAYYSELI